MPHAASLLAVASASSALLLATLRLSRRRHADSHNPHATNNTKRARSRTIVAEEPYTTSYVVSTPRAASAADAHPRDHAPATPFDRVNSTTELPMSANEAISRVDAVVKPFATSHFVAAVPPGETMGVRMRGGAALRLFWRANAAPSPEQLRFDGMREAEEWREELTFTHSHTPCADAPVRMHLALSNPTNKGIAFSLLTCLEPTVEKAAAVEEASAAAAAADASGCARLHTPRRELLPLLRRALRRLVLQLRVIRLLRVEVVAQRAKKGRTSMPRPSMRMLEARAHSYLATDADGDQITRGWQEMAETAKSCTRTCRLWEDPDFPHEHSSLFLGVARQRRRRGGGKAPSSTPGGDADAGGVAEQVVWLSLRQLLGEPHEWPGGRKSYLYEYERHAAEKGESSPRPLAGAQGSLGNCFFLSAVTAAMSNLSIRSDLIDESLEAAGMYGVSFYVSGRWRMVWIDSYFPCVPASEEAARAGTEVIGYAGANWRPIYSRSLGRREAWLMVVEKAFAKLHSCYEALDGGHVSSVLAMLSGGIPSTQLLRAAPSAPARRGAPAAPTRACEGAPAFSENQLWALLTRALADSGFVCLATPADGSFSGYVPDHAYAVLQLSECDGCRSVLLRDPWGLRGIESRQEQEPMAPTPRGITDEGTFWVPLAELRREFATMFACRVLRTTLSGGPWHFSLLSNAWRGESAGGCPNFVDTWRNNPQLHVRPVHKATKLVLLLTQPPRGNARLLANAAPAAAVVEEAPARYHAIGLVVLRGRISVEGDPLKRGEMLSASKYLRASHVSLEVELTPSSGPYTIVVSTFAPREEASFALYAYSNEEVEWLPCDDGWAIEHEDSGGQEGNLIVASRRTRALLAARGVTPTGMLPVSEVLRAAATTPPLVVAPPPAMLSRFSGSFLQVRNSLLRNPDVYSEFYDLRRSQMLSRNESLVSNSGRSLVGGRCSAVSIETSARMSSRRLSTTSIRGRASHAGDEQCIDPVEVQQVSRNLWPSPRKQPCPVKLQTIISCEQETAR